jgi:pimeloyl-ACP methyl ester carboxylesterase
VEPVTAAGVAAAKLTYTDVRPRLARHHRDPDTVFASWTDVWTADWFRDWNVERYLDTIACPVLLIQGRDDEFGTEAQLSAIARGRADRSILMLEHCGHSPHRDQTAAVLKAAATFVDRV